MVIKFALAEDSTFVSFADWYEVNRTKDAPETLKIHINRDSINVSKLLTHVGYKTIKYCGATLSFYNKFLVIKLRLEFTDPVDKLKDGEKSFNILSTKIFESYQVSKNTTRGLMTWHPMRKEPVSDYATKYMCSEIHRGVKKDLLSLLEDDDDDFGFLD